MSGRLTYSVPAGTYLGRRDRENVYSVEPLVVDIAFDELALSRLAIKAAFNESHVAKVGPCVATVRGAGRGQRASWRSGKAKGGRPCA